MVNVQMVATVHHPIRFGREQMLASQMPRAGTRVARPERDLWCEVLRDAVRVAKGLSVNLGHGSRPGIIGEAKDWIRTIDYDVGGFDFCCDLSDVDPSCLRETLNLRCP